MSLVEVFVTGSKRSTFLLGADQVIKMNSEQPMSTDQDELSNKILSTDQHIFSVTREVWQGFCTLKPCKFK